MNPSFLVLLVLFPIKSGFSRFAPGSVLGFSRFVLLLFLGLLTAPTRNSPERVHDTIRTFPARKWETPWFGNPSVYLLSIESGAKNSPKRLVPDIPTNIRSKTSVRPSKSWKTSILAQTSLGDVHEQNFSLKSSGLISRSLLKAKVDRVSAYSLEKMPLNIRIR